MIPIHKYRVSSNFDAARRFALFSVNRENEVLRNEVLIDHVDPIDKAKRIVELDVSVVICGAISWPAELMLVSADVAVIPNTCGLAQEVFSTFAAGEFTEKTFLMPGCNGQRRRLSDCHRRDRSWNNPKEKQNR